VKKAAAVSAPAWAEPNRDREQDRRHGEILRQEDGEARPAGRRVETLPLREHRQHDRGRGQGQREAGHDRLDMIEAELEGDRGERRRTGEDLQRAEPEDEAPQAAQAHP